MDQLLAAQPLPEEADIREALDRLLRYSGLRKSRQLSAFLTYIVEARLANRSEQIKAYTIAVDAFGRRPNFDPQLDPIVRVAARRLRLVISEYYVEAGAGDAVRITIPTGGYVPVFSWAVPPNSRPIAITTRASYIERAVVGVVAVGLFMLL